MENQLNIIQFCQSQIINQAPGMLANSHISCGPCPKERDYEYNPLSPLVCFCSDPLRVGYRLKSPGFSDFLPYVDDFEEYLTSGLGIILYQLYLESFEWGEGPRLKMNLKLFPDRASLFNTSEVIRIRSMFTGWLIPDSDLFGPYKLLNFTLGSYAEDISGSSSSGLSTGAIVGIVLGAIAGAVSITVIVMILFIRRHPRYRAVSRKRLCWRINFS